MVFVPLLGLLFRYGLTSPWIVDCNCVEVAAFVAEAVAGPGAVSGKVTNTRYVGGG